MKPGVFISFEGTEGCGKSTQVARLASRLRACGRVVRSLREPGGTPLAEEIRQTLKHSPNGASMVPEAELLLMNAARAQLVREVIRPALAAGEVVLCDRFYDSTVAYQGWGRGLGEAAVRAIIDFAVGGTRPSLTLWLRVPAGVAMARRVERARVERGGAGEGGGGVEDRFEAAGAAFFERVEAGFAAIAAAESQRLVPVDASGSADAVEALIWDVVIRRLEMIR